MSIGIDQIKAALKSNRDQLLQHQNVVATGVGYKITGNQKIADLSIVCSVSEKRPTAKLAGKDLVPRMIAGIPTDVVQTGPIRALQSPTERYRPAPGGVSIGHYAITAGTFGCLVKRNGRLMILSNNHVLANSNDANIGDPILQPGPHDGGSNPQDHLADLADFVPVRFSETPSECPVAGGVTTMLNGFATAVTSKTRLQAVELQVEDNLVDAAIARPLNEEDVKNEILNVGTVTGTAEGTLGLAIKKSGRTTGYTTGEILQVEVTVNVQYGVGRIARFSDQLMAGPMSQGGDSGSAVVDENNQLVGLLFAGSDQSTIINRIQNVFTALRVGL